MELPPPMTKLRVVYGELTFHQYESTSSFVSLAASSSLKESRIRRVQRFREPEREQWINHSVEEGAGQWSQAFRHTVARLHTQIKTSFTCLHSSNNHNLLGFSSSSSLTSSNNNFNSSSNISNNSPSNNVLFNNSNSNNRKCSNRTITTNHWLHTFISYRLPTQPS